MKYIRKLLLPLFLVFILTAGLTACSGEDVTQSTDSSVSSEETDLSDSKESTDAEEAVQSDTGSNEAAEETALSDADSNETSTEENLLDPDGSYTTKEDVALYLHQYGELPSNFITKKEAQALGWEGGSLEEYAPGKCIGGTTFGNYEGLLPQKEGRTYKECDIDTLGAKKRGAKRIVYSNDGLIYYTEDHYETFELLYGNP